MPLPPASAGSTADSIPPVPDRANASNQPVSPMALSNGSRGVIGIQGIMLLLDVVPGGAQEPIIESNSRNVKLDTGTQMVLQVKTPVQ